MGQSPARGYFAAPSKARAQRERHQTGTSSDTGSTWTLSAAASLNIGTDASISLAVTSRNPSEFARQLFRVRLCVFARSIANVASPVVRAVTSVLLLWVGAPRRLTVSSP